MYDRWLDPPSPERFWCGGCSKETDHGGEDEGLCVDCNTWADVESREKPASKVEAGKGNTHTSRRITK